MTFDFLKKDVTTTS